MLQVNRIANHALATHADIKNERVVMLEITCNLRCKALHPYGEELAFAHKIGLVQFHWVTDGVFLVHGIV